MRLLLAFVFVAGCAHPVIATAPAPEPPHETYQRPLTVIDVPATFSADERAAVQTLGNATEFGGASVGYVGTPVPEVEALRTLLATPHATEAFEIVIDHGTLPAQLMALSALWVADRTAFDAHLPPYLDLETPVTVLEDGCSFERQNVPASSLVRLSHPGPGFDIVSGTYPRQLAGR